MGHSQDLFQHVVRHGWQQLWRRQVAGAAEGAEVVVGNDRRGDLVTDVAPRLIED